jgi:hypothetical protein
MTSIRRTAELTDGTVAFTRGHGLGSFLMRCLAACQIAKDTIAESRIYPNRLFGGNQFPGTTSCSETAARRGAKEAPWEQLQGET